MGLRVFDYQSSDVRVERGWLEIQERVIQVPDMEPRITRTPRVTGKGQLYFVNRFMSEYQ